MIEKLIEKLIEKNLLTIYLKYTDTDILGDITLISPSMTGLRKMSSICEQYASEYDILFNGSKSKLLFFKGRCCNVSTLGIVVCGQLVEMSDTAVHLGHTITSNDRDNITKSAKSSFWKSFNILIAEFGKLSPFVISKLFNQYCCSFYGSTDTL